MSANNNRRLKGLAQDALKKLGYLDVYASDSGSNVIIVNDTVENITKLEKIVGGTRFTDRTHDKKTIGFYITVGKANCKRLGIDYNLKQVTIWTDGGKTADVYSD